MYQEGRSEIILGKALKGRRDRMILATKVGSVIPREGRDISPGHIEEAVEASLRRLQTDYIDVYQLHSPQLHHLQGEQLARGHAEPEGTGQDSLLGG